MCSLYYVSERDWDFEWNLCGFPQTCSELPLKNQLFKYLLQPLNGLMSPR